jgi:hypothetical protein
VRILILSSCTKSKLPHKAPAGSLYTGASHAHILKGISAARFGGDEVDHWIYSALHGPVPADEVLEPYDVTWKTMHPADRKARRGWMGHRVRALVAQPGRYDLAIVALGEDYAEGTDLHRCPLAQPTVRLVANPLQTVRDFDLVVPAGIPEAKRFRCGLVGLKGEMVRRLLTAGVHHRGEALRGLPWDLSPLDDLA